MGGEESDECRPVVRDRRPSGFERLFPLPVGVRHVRRIAIMLPLGATGGSLSLRKFTNGPRLGGSIALSDDRTDATRRISPHLYLILSWRLLLSIA